MPKRKTRIERVVWVDSSSPSDSSWLQDDEIDEFFGHPLKCLTVGINVRESKKVLVLASSRSSFGQVYGVISIPKVAIVSRKRLG